MDNRFELADWLTCWFTEQYGVDWQHHRAATYIPRAVGGAYTNLLLVAMPMIETRR